MAKDVMAVQPPRKGLKPSTKENLTGYAFLIPMIVGLSVFVVYPLIECFRLSLFGTYPGQDDTFVGFGNYAYAFKDAILRGALGNTFIMAAYTLVLVIPGSFILASMIHAIPRFKTPYKVLYYLPNVTSVVAISLLFRYVFYSTDQGIVNYFLGWFGIDPIPFFNDTRWSQISIAIMSFWQGIGSNMLICLAGLTSISPVYYEAADVDGASGFQKWWYITVPSARPTLVYLLIMTTMSAMKRFTDVYLIGNRNAAPGGALRTVVHYMYVTNFHENNRGYASTIAVLLFLIILVLTIINMRLVRYDNDLD